MSQEALPATLLGTSGRALTDRQKQMYTAEKCTEVVKMAKEIQEVAGGAEGKDWSCCGDLRHARV